MLSQEAELALGRLAEGAVLNPIHTTARELIAAGLACNDWGHLALTEEGRRVARKAGPYHRIFAMDDPHVYNLANPMGLGPEVQVIPAEINREPSPVWTNTPRPATNYDRALQAAGVASGKTGVWPETEWVHAFMDAWIDGERNE